MPPRVYRGLALGAVSMVSRVGCPDGQVSRGALGPPNEMGGCEQVSPLEAQGPFGAGMRGPQEAERGADLRNETSSASNCLICCRCRMVMRQRD